MNYPKIKDLFFSLPTTDQSLIVKEYIESTPLQSQRDPILMLAKKVYKYRSTHKDFVPLEVFKSLIGMSGAAVSVQIVHEVIEKGKHIGFALRMRDASEAGAEYAGKYHNTCCSFRMYDTPKSALDRNDADALGKLNTPPEFLGVTIHHKESRCGADITMMHRRFIGKHEIKFMEGDWKFFSKDDILYHHNKIVESNLWQLQCVMNIHPGAKPLFSDIRPK